MGTKSKPPPLENFIKRGRKPSPIPIAILKIAADSSDLQNIIGSTTTRERTLILNAVCGFGDVYDSLDWPIFSRWLRDNAPKGDFMIADFCIQLANAIDRSKR